jgi:hypothetical protein
MSTEGTTIVEINGVKMEVDLRHAKVIHENLRIGTKVKLLAKSSYAAPSVHAGVIVAFDMFPSQPTITVAYIKTGYGTESPLQFAHVNSGAEKNWELVPSVDDDLPLAKVTVLEQMDRALEAARAKVLEIEHQRVYFVEHFGAFFEKQPAETT